MSEQANAELNRTREAVINALKARPKKARFITEVAAALWRFAIRKDELERALSELQAEGVVVVRDNFCADPHLADVDLRVAALVDEAAGGADGHVAALREIDLAWNKWLGEYLANHRCG